MTTAKKAFLFPSVLVATLSVATSIQMKQVAAACGINWTTSQPDCVAVVDKVTDRSFSYSLQTSWTSRFQTTWTMSTVFTPGNSEHIVSASVTPSTHTITITDTSVQSAGVVNTVNAGSLETGESEGTFEMSAIDVTHFMCAAAHAVTVQEDPCP